MPIAGATSGVFTGASSGSGGASSGGSGWAFGGGSAAPGGYRGGAPLPSSSPPPSSATGPYGSAPGYGGGGMADLPPADYLARQAALPVNSSSSSTGPYAGMTPQSLYAQAFAQQQGIYAPQNAALDARGADLANRAALSNSMYAQQAALLQSGSGLDSASLANQAAGNQIALGAAGRQQSVLDALHNNTVAGFGNDRQYFTNLLGIRGNELATAKLANQNAYSNNIWGANSDATARGAVGSQGLTQAHSNLLNQLTTGNQQAQNTYDFEAGRANRGLTDTNNASNAEGINYGEQTQKNSDNLAGLKNVAESYGIKQDQLANALQQGLARLNMNGTVNLQQISDALSGNDQSKALVAQQITKAALDAVSRSGMPINTSAITTAPALSGTRRAAI